MPLSAVSVLVVAQSSSEIPEGLMNNPVFTVSPVEKASRINPKHAVLLINPDSLPL